MLEAQGEQVRQDLQKYAEELAEVRNQQLRFGPNCLALPKFRVSYLCFFLRFRLYLQREEAEKEQKKDEEFTRLAQNLHHLVSTKRIPGIYKPLPHYNNVSN